jgi:hypothetical protein
MRNFNQESNTARMKKTLHQAEVSEDQRSGFFRKEEGNKNEKLRFEECVILRWNLEERNKEIVI